MITRGLLKTLKEDFSLKKDYDFKYDIWLCGELLMCKGL